VNFEPHHLRGYSMEFLEVTLAQGLWFGDSKHQPARKLLSLASHDRQKVVSYVGSLVYQVTELKRALGVL